MQRRVRGRVLVAGCPILAATLLLFSRAAAGLDQAAATSPNGPRFIRSVSGTKGVEKGALYEIEDPRSSFSLPQDRQVTVYFEWEGELGLYRFEGRWKDPTGRVVLVVPAEYLAKTRRFGVRWTLALPDTVVNGLWALEVLADGQPAGMHALSISSPISTQGPSTDEIYRTATRAVAALQRVATDGTPLGVGAATAVDADHLATSFTTIEAAARIRVALGGGRSVETQTVTAWNRREGWALLSVPGHGLSPLTRAGRNPAVGDHVFILEPADRGDLVLRETRIMGSRQAASGRGLLRIELPATAGSPALNAGGEILGFLVGGSSNVELGGSATRFLALEDQREVGMLVVPLDLLPTPAEASPATLEEPAARNVFAKPLSEARRDVISGVFAGRVDRSGNVPMPFDQGSTFSRRQATVSVFLQWAPSGKREALSHFEVYDTDNRLLGKSDPNKLKFRPGELLFSTWAFTVGKLSPGIYRVDALLDEKPAWRGYLQITD